MCIEREVLHEPTLGRFAGLCTFPKMKFGAESSMSGMSRFRGTWTASVNGFLLALAGLEVGTAAGPLGAIENA